MLMDMHSHSSEISLCCQISAPEVMKRAKKAGIDALCLTNHYQASYLKDNDADAFAHQYAAAYEYARECAKKAGIRLFFGIEVTAMQHDNAHLLLYGLQPSFATEHPRMFEYSQEKLFRLVSERGEMLVQAHPFRNHGYVLNTDWMDGIEINCHPLYDGTHSKEILKIATECGIVPTCGGDYHADTYRPVCGVYFPDTVITERDMVQYLKSTLEIHICIHELHSSLPVDCFWKRP